MRWQQSEFIFKGIYLGILLFVGLLLREPAWPSLALVGVCTFGTLALCMTVTAARMIRSGYRVRGRIGAFVLFLLLENPGMVYAGVLLGMMLGAFAMPEREEGERYWLLYCVLGGAVLGLAFNVLYHVNSGKV